MGLQTVPRRTDGLVLVDKPAGMSSHDVVSAARRAIGERRIGHGGTLDPFATGLLVLLVGRATRLLPHLSGEPKLYEAVVSFGAETDTEDSDGKVIREAPLPERTAMLSALSRLCGSISQLPPAYSAKLVAGERAYDLARRGVEFELKPVMVNVYRWDVLDMKVSNGLVSEARVRVSCGGGTYVRSLARDLGRFCGSAAHLKELRRLASGIFSVNDALTLDGLESGDFSLRPPLDAIPDYPVQGLCEEDAMRIGRGLDIAAVTEGKWGALVSSSNGSLVAVAERIVTDWGERWQPRVVLPRDE